MKKRHSVGMIDEGHENLSKTDGALSKIQAG
jgi:hypothetical protein